MNNSRFFLDTAYVIALLNPYDTYHEKAKISMFSIRDAQEVWTTEGVLIEIGNALSRLNRAAAVSFINSCYITPNVRIVTIDRLLFRRGVEFYSRREDKEWGLTDCISFLVMQDNGITNVLTTDEHFQQAGFHALLLNKEHSN